MQLSTTPKAPQIDAVLGARYAIADHREVWERVLPGLEEMHAIHRQQDWDIAGIRQMLDEDTALLLVDEADASNFAVVRFDDYPYVPGDKELYIFLVWHQGGDAITRFQPHLEVFARLGGARHIRFYSQRRAFLRVAQSFGYQPRSIEYVKELDHG